MADNAVDATSSAPGSSSVSTKVTGEPPTSDSKTPSGGITPSTPQPASSGSGAEPPQIKPNTTNNPKPVSDAEQKASTTNAVASKADAEPAVKDNDRPKGDEDWDTPPQLQPDNLYSDLRSALNKWAEQLAPKDENPHYNRHRNVSRALDEGALSEANAKLHEVADIVVSHLNGGR